MSSEFDQHSGHDPCARASQKSALGPIRLGTIQGLRAEWCKVVSEVPCMSLLQAPGVSARFLELLAGPPRRRSRILDVGCGGGASRWRSRPPPDGWWASIARAPRASRRPAPARGGAGLAGTSSSTRPTSSADLYEPGRPDRLTRPPLRLGCHHRARGPSPAPGACLAMVSFHVDQWKETGPVSRFAYDEARMRIALEVTRLRRRGARGRAGRDAASTRSRQGWPRRSASRTGGGGRPLVPLHRLPRSGGRTLTRSHLLVKARRGERSARRAEPAEMTLPRPCSPTRSRPWRSSWASTS